MCLLCGRNKQLSYPTHLYYSVDDDDDDEDDDGIDDDDDDDEKDEEKKKADGGDNESQGQGKHNHGDGAVVGVDGWRVVCAGRGCGLCSRSISVSRHRNHPNLNE